jgi:hypothetical protein
MMDAMMRVPLFAHHSRYVAAITETIHVAFHLGGVLLPQRHDDAVPVVGGGGIVAAVIRAVGHDDTVAVDGGAEAAGIVVVVAAAAVDFLCVASRSSYQRGHLV